jgi:hypothetical protein
VTNGLAGALVTAVGLGDGLSTAQRCRHSALPQSLHFGGCISVFLKWRISAVISFATRGIVSLPLAQAILFVAKALVIKEKRR